MEHTLLENINSPDDLKKLTKEQIKPLCEEIRDTLIETVSHTGGHLASNLGVVELTVALHRVFDSPKDQIVFDVGHQCYVHKLITGRAGMFDTLRCEGGLSGFPKPNESPHDPMIAGHSSNSISAALGLAKAKSLAGDDHHVIAIIGDGALTGGLAYEGLNNAGRGHDKLIVILNDNKMSINKNVGAMARHLALIRTRKSYIRFKTGINRTFGKLPVVGKAIRKTLFSSGRAVKSTMYKKSTIFEDMGYIYLGPVDGHDEELLENVLETAKYINKPVVIHICTLKGKGYTYAEKKPRKFHGINSFDIETGEPKFSGDTFSSVFGKSLCTLAKEDERICAITAAMKSGTGLDKFAEEYRHRFFDVGIAEGHAVTFACGLAANGMKPVFAVYSSFLQRAYDQLIHDAAIAGEGITIVVDRAGIVGDDGETHQGMFDVAMVSTIPGFVIFSPAYFDEVEPCLRMAVDYSGPAVVRIPRGHETPRPDGVKCDTADYTVTSNGHDTLVVTYGRIAGFVYKAAENKADVMKLLKIYPLSDECIKAAAKYKNILFVEEGIKSGGIGQSFCEMLLASGYNGKYLHHAIDAQFVPQASVDSALHKLRLDTDGISSLIDEVIGNERKTEA